MLEEGTPARYLNQLDRIFISGDLAGAAKTRLVSSLVSDHKMIYVEFTIRTKFQDTFKVTFFCKGKLI